MPEKIGAGGHEQPYDSGNGEYMGSGGGNGSSGGGKGKMSWDPGEKPTPRQLTIFHYGESAYWDKPEIPDIKKGYVKQEEWGLLYSGVTSLPDLTEIESKVYMTIMGLEGGMHVDQKSGASSGITPIIMREMTRQGIIPANADGTIRLAKDLSAEERALVYRAYFNSKLHFLESPSDRSWKTLLGGQGQTDLDTGRRAMAQLCQAGGEEATMAVMDTIFQHGQRGGAEMIRMTLKDMGYPVDSLEGDLDRKTWNQTLSAVKDDDSRERFLLILAGKRMSVAKPAEKEGVWPRFEYFWRMYQHNRKG